MTAILCRVLTNIFKLYIFLCFILLLIDYGIHRDAAYPDIVIGAVKFKFQNFIL